MDEITAEVFWDFYARRLEMLNKKAFEDYHQDSSWTPIIMQIVKDVLKSDLSLGISKEYMRIDAIGYKKLSRNNWRLKIAYEHENSDDWDDELCKLSHVVANLRVISSYYDFTSKTSLADVLSKRLGILGKPVVSRVPNSTWLFVFGPRYTDYSKPFVAYKVNSDMQIQDITDGHNKIIPKSWQ